MKSKTFRFLLPFLRPYLGRYFLGILLAPVSTGLSLMAPRLLGKAVEELRRLASQRQGELREVMVLAAAIVAIAIGRGVLLFAVRMLIIGGSRGFEYDLRNRLFASLEGLDARFHRRFRTGDLMSRLTSDIEGARTLAGPVVMYSANALSTLAIALPFMASVDPFLTALVMVPLTLLTLAVKLIGPRVHAASRRAREVFAELSSYAQEDFAGVRVVKSFAREEAEIAGFRAVSERQLETNMVVERLSNWMGPVVGSTGEVASILLLLVGGFLILRGGLNLGQFVEFAGYQALLIWPMISIGWVLNQAHRGAASAARLEEIISARSEVADPVVNKGRTGDGRKFTAEDAEDAEDGRTDERSISPVATPSLLAPRPAREVEVRGLTFGYDGRMVLSGLSLRAPRGGLTAVIGRTGSGKSTLLGLVPRLWRPPDGTIFIDGVDANRIPLAELRRLIGFVPQESFLFSRTILENIAFAVEGEEAPAEERARACARVARLDQDVDQFPRGYGELVGERGVTLSGGQRQRVAIARALLLDPPILILDDPLSAVDAHTEEEILRNLREATRGRTVILATHRLSALRDADRIYVIDGGRVAEEGTHEALRGRGGIYAALLERQILTDELEDL